MRAYREFTSEDEKRHETWRNKHYGRKDKPLCQLEREWWQDLSLQQRKCAVEHLRKVLPDEIAQGVREARVKHGDEWMDHIFEDDSIFTKDPELYGFYAFHHAEGMGIRNALRDVIADADLPSGNWDDFYVPALEIAAGVWNGRYDEA